MIVLIATITVIVSSCKSLCNLQRLAGKALLIDGEDSMRQSSHLSRKDVEADEGKVKIMIRIE